MNSIRLIHVDVPMTEPFHISSGVVVSKESILIRIEMDGCIGWGEASPMSGAFYSKETPETCWQFLAEKAVPTLIERRAFTPDYAVSEMWRGAGDAFSWAGMEGALLSLQFQQGGIGFLDYFEVDAIPIHSGLAVGIYPTIDELIDACKRYMTDGYKRLKIKIQPGWDEEPLRAVREVFGDLALMVDANAAYRESDIETLKQLDQFNLMMIEQPLPAADLKGHANLQSQISTPVCLDESADNLSAVQEAINLKACKIVNLKIQRIGGLQETRRIHNLCYDAGIPNWMGTMPELGIAGLHALYLALLCNCSYPTDVEASRRWFVEDIIDPQIEVKDGLIVLPPEHRKMPNVNETTVEKYTVRTEQFPF